jgi:hypothetical protein
VPRTFDFALAELALGQWTTLMHANAIEGIQNSTMAKNSDDISIPNHLDSLAFGQRVARSYASKSHRLSNSFANSILNHVRPIGDFGSG